MRDNRSVEGPHEIALFTELDDPSQRPVITIPGDVDYPTRAVLDLSPEIVGAMDMTEVRALGRRAYFASNHNRINGICSTWRIFTRFPFWTD